MINRALKSGKSWNTLLWQNIIKFDYKGKAIIKKWNGTWSRVCIDLPYRLELYETLNRTSSQIVRVAAASRLAHEFRIELPPKVKIKNSTSSVYSRLIRCSTGKISFWFFCYLDRGINLYAIMIFRLYKNWRLD